MKFGEIVRRMRGEGSRAETRAASATGCPLVLIDGINFFYRGAWSHAEVPDCHGEDISYVLAFFRNLARTARRVGRAEFVVCWDGGYDERLRISSEAVAAGLIPKSYKQERREARETEDPEEKAKAEAFVRQMGVARDFLAHTVVGQCQAPGEEADDVIGSLARRFRDEFSRVLLVTTDRDYYQLIDEKTVIYDAKDGSEKGLDFLRREYGLSGGAQWIDVGALAGEAGKSSDTIYGVRGVGYATAAKMIAEFGTLEGVLSHARALVAENGARDAAELAERVRSGRTKIAGVSRKSIDALAAEPVVRLARRLKEIRTFLDVDIPAKTPSYTEFTACFQRLGVPFPEADRDYLTDASNCPGTHGAINANSGGTPADMPEEPPLF